MSLKEGMLESFDAKKTRYFAALGLRLREAMQVHKAAGLWDKKDKKREWGNITEHCLVAATRTETLADMLGISGAVKEDLLLAVALHDANKKEEVLAPKRAAQEGASPTVALYESIEGGAERLGAAGASPRVVELAESSGGLPETTLRVLDILEKEGNLSDEELARLVVYYVDAYTRNAEWALPAETEGSKGEARWINDVDRRVKKNEHYREAELDIIRRRVPDHSVFRGKTLSEVMGQTAHEI